MTYPYIERRDDGTACLARHPRVRVIQVVMDQMAHGWTAEELTRQYPHLTPAEIHAAMLYYWDHRDALDAEIRAEWRLADLEGSTATLPPAIERKLRRTS